MSENVPSWLTIAILLFCIGFDCFATLIFFHICNCFLFEVLLRMDKKRLLMTRQWRRSRWRKNSFSAAIRATIRCLAQQH